MSTSQWITGGAGLLLLFALLSGVGVARSGRPHSSIVLTIHKLLALAAAVTLVALIYQANEVAALSALELAVGLAAGLLFLGAGISGALVSLDKPPPAVVSIMHRITPCLTALSAAVTLYLLLER